MRKKIYSLGALLLLLWPVAALMNSCSKPCGHFNCIYYTNVGLKAIDNADSTKHELVNGVVMAKGLLLQVQVHDSIRTDTAGVCSSSFQSSSFITAAYAIHKACQPDLEKDVLKSFTIFSDKDFDAKHPAHSDLQDLFYCSSKTPYNYSGIFDFYLSNEPAVEGIHVFTVQLTYTNGKILTASTSPIKLLKK